ncbi:MAG: hypothetical protein ACTJLM_03515 [Ehrlichia sp.]
MSSIECKASQHNCLGLVYALNNCTGYTCNMNFLNNKVRYTVFGIIDDRCKMSEVDDSGVTLCYFPKEKIRMMSEYLVRVITNNMNIETNKIEHALSKVCEFYSTVQGTLIQENAEITEDNALEVKRAVELEKRNFNVGKIGSIFFSDVDIVKLHTIYAQGRNIEQDN